MKKCVKMSILALAVSCSSSVFAATGDAVDKMNLSGEYYVGSVLSTHTQADMLSNIAAMSSILNGGGAEDTTPAKGLGYQRIALTTAYLTIDKMFSDNGMMARFVKPGARDKVAKAFGVSYDAVDRIVKSYAQNPDTPLADEKEEKLRQAFLFSEKVKAMQADLSNALPKVVSHVDKMTDAINTNDKAVKANATSISTTDAKAEKNKTDIATANGEIAKLKTDKADASALATTEAKAEKNKTDLATANGEIATLKADKANKSDLDSYAKKTEVSLTNNTGDIMKNREAIAANTMAIKEVDQKVEKTGALSAALAGLKGLAYDAAKPTQVMGAVSTYKGKQAYAFGVSHYTTGDLMIHGGFAFSGTDDVMANIGATIKIGSGHTPMSHDNSEVMKLREEIEMLKAQHESEKREWEARFQEVIRMVHEK